jgi:hypothetical protein
VAEHDGDHPGHVEALLTTGQPAAEHEVVQRRRVQLRDLVQRGLHDRGGQVVRAEPGHGALGGAADRGTGGGDYDGLGHGGLPRQTAFVTEE